LANAQVTGLGSPINITGLPDGTYYARVAAYDLWSSYAPLLNWAAQDTFVINIGATVESDPDVDGDGLPCVTEDTPVLMADRSYKPAGEVHAGETVWTQHEHTLEWGAYKVLKSQIVPCDDVWEAQGIRASGDHRLWLNGWKRVRDIGAPSDPAKVVRLTVEDAHTYYSAGVLSHNIKMFP
jgi:hypothetical protein